MLHNILPVAISKLLSLLQATTLRDRYYTALERIELLETAIMDIERISASRSTQSERHRLIAGICDRVQNK